MSSRRPRYAPLGGTLSLLVVSAAWVGACSSEDVARNRLLLDAGTDASGGVGGAGAGGLGGSAGASVAGSGGSAAGSSGGTDAGAGAGDAGEDAVEDASEPPCPEDMVLIDAPSLPSAVCMDRFEAPNREGEPPLVMLNFNESSAWCERRGKRLCFDDEWTFACAGPAGLKYPYGDTREPGVCNDNKPWKVYSQSLLNGWPYGFDGSPYDSLPELLAAVGALSSAAQAAADHVAELYQAERAGQHPGCLGASGVRDLTGNVEEWTQRRDGGAPDFHGNLKGRYWADTRTCQNNITSHGDGFRFYEIGLRCCQDARVGVGE